MTYTLARILSVAVLGAAMTACATVPGDPYYEPGYQQPGYIYGTAQPVSRISSSISATSASELTTNFSW